MQNDLKLYISYTVDFHFITLGQIISESLVLVETTSKQWRTMMFKSSMLVVLILTQIMEASLKKVTLILHQRFFVLKYSQSIFSFCLICLMV